MELTFEICPWSRFLPATFSFWEESRCAWVCEPANTWSNLAYVIVGIYLLMKYRQVRWSPVKFFAWVSILVGICSGLYHASGTFLFQCTDLASMFLVVTLMLTLNLRRAGWIRQSSVYYSFWGCFALSMAILLNFHMTGRVIFILLMVSALAIEAYLYMTSKEYHIKPLITAISIMGVSFVFWQLDLKGMLARPDNHFFQGHAMWHVVSSVAFIYLYRFYDQFQMLSPRRLRLLSVTCSSATEWLYGRIVCDRKSSEKTA